MEADLARQIAQNTKGVVDVMNRLTISKDKSTKE